MRANSLRVPRAGVVFDRNEVAGAFGNLGIPLPLILSMIAVNGLDAASAFTMYGLFQILTAFTFGVPIPVQPLKAMAAIMLTQRLPASYLFGGGLVVGIFFTILGVTKLIEWLNRAIPISVVRGIQLGLGLQLLSIASQFMLKDGSAGLILSIVGVVITLLLFSSRRLPPALLLLAIGLSYAFATGLRVDIFWNGAGLMLPKFFLPSFNDLLMGTVLLAVPQIPLSLGNSIIGTSLLSLDLFPKQKPVTTKSLSISYGLMNLVSPFVSGIPMCHGAGGLAGHHRFGARTGGALIIIGSIFLTVGLLYSRVVQSMMSIFPFSILGVMLFFSGLELALTMRGVVAKRDELFVTLFVAALAAFVPYGYVIGLVAGWILAKATQTTRFKFYTNGA